MIKSKKRNFVKGVSVTLIILIGLSFFTGCTDDNETTDTTGTAQEDQTTQDEGSDGITYTNFSFSDEDEDDSWNETDAEIILLNGNDIEYEGNSAEVDGAIITIEEAGTYVFSGTLHDGQIVVDTTDSGIVRIVLNGVDITCNDSAPIYVVSSEKTVIVLADGTENTITDGSDYDLDSEDEPSAAIFSKSDLAINGSGTLIVNANYNDGIKSKDDLILTGGTIVIDAVADGLVGKDCLVIKGADITINAGCDGMQATNDTDTNKGFLLIYSGTFDITAGEDGIQAETDLVIGGGTFVIETAGGSSNSVSSLNDQRSYMPGDSDSSSTDSSVSAKGLKAGVSVTLSDATVTIDSADDAIHTNDTVTIESGVLNLTSGDDGIHADTELTINGGTITIAKSYEGIESATITINAGKIDITASDDGVNVAGGNDSSSMSGRPGEGNFNSSGNNWLYINGGTLIIDSVGDGLDANGSIAMTDGIVIVSGPTSSGNGALDYDGTFTIDGGFLVAAGSSGMVMTPSSSSELYSVSITFSSSISEGTAVHIESEDGDDIVTFVAAKDYQNIVVCSSELQNGETYIVSTGGSVSGDNDGGYYSNGSYSGGSEYTSFTISSSVTSVGSYSGSGGGGMKH